MAFFLDRMEYCLTYVCFVPTFVGVDVVALVGWAWCWAASSAWYPGVSFNSRADVESGNQMLATRPRLESYLATVALSLIISSALAINKGHLGHA